MAVNTARRFFLLKSQAQDDFDQPMVAAVYRAKQQAEVSIALPATFPLRTELIAHGYSTKADLDGADVAELKLRVGLTSAQATAVIAAVPTIV